MFHYPDYWKKWLLLSVVWLILCILCGTGALVNGLLNDPMGPPSLLAERSIPISVHHNNIINEKTPLLSHHEETHESLHANQVEMEIPMAHGTSLYRVDKTAIIEVCKSEQMGSPRGQFLQMAISFGTYWIFFIIPNAGIEDYRKGLTWFPSMVWAISLPIIMGVMLVLAYKHILTEDYRKDLRGMFLNHKE